MKGKIYTPLEVAELTGKTRLTIYRHINEGKLKSTKLVGRVVITKKDLEEYLGPDLAKALLNGDGGK